MSIGTDPRDISLGLNQGSKSRQKSCTISCTTKIVHDSHDFHDKIFVVHDFVVHDFLGKYEILDVFICWELRTFSRPFLMYIFSQILFLKNG